MLSTQSPVSLPRIHSPYSDLPAPSRRAANLPFFAPRASPSPSSSSSMYSRRSAPPPPRRNAISYHPSQPSSENPFTDRRPLSPTPRKAVLISSGHTTAEPKPMTYSSASSPPIVLALPPARVPRSQREYQAKMVANLLLHRAGRARPMRGARRLAAHRPGSGYVRSGLSVCVVAEEDQYCEYPESDSADDSDEA